MGKPWTADPRYASSSGVSRATTTRPVLGGRTELLRALASPWTPIDRSDYAPHVPSRSKDDDEARSPAGSALPAGAAGPMTARKPGRVASTIDASSARSPMDQ